MKRALQHLAEDGKIVCVGYGLWRKVDSSGSSTLTPTDTGDTAFPEMPPETEALTIEDQIGDGDETVYIYFNPNDRRLAELEDRDTWECKIGRSSAAVVDRIVAQGVKTALSHPPVIGLLIKCADSAALETALHASLRLADCEVDDSLGSEWFHTSPSRVKSWFLAFSSAMSCLTAKSASIGTEIPNQASDATLEPAPGAGSSSHQG